MLCTLVLFSFIFSNLKSHSVYYAQHTPHAENVEPVLMMLVDNIAYIYHPELEGIGYDFDGEPAILFYDEEGVQTGFISPLDEEYYYTEEKYFLKKSARK